MKREQTDKSATPPVILMVRADALSLAIDNGLKIKVKIVHAKDPHSALNSFESERPSLIVCNVDEKGNRYNSLFRRAADRGVPVIALATTDEAVEAVENVSHFLDRRAERAIITLSQRLLDDPSFVPESLSSYPPPPKSGEIDTDGRGGGSASRSTRSVNLSAAMAGKPLPQKKTEKGTGEDWYSGSLAQLGMATAALKKRVDALEAHTRTELLDNGNFINAVAAENAAFYEELKETIRQVAENAHRSTDALRDTLNELLKALPLSDSDQESKLEELRQSLSKRDSKLDALQHALETVEARGTARESDFREQIDALVSQITRISSTPPSPDAGNVSVEELIADYESRFAEIEIAVSRLEKPGTRAPASESFTSEFEELWDTQLIIKQLQGRVSTLESKVKGDRLSTEATGTASDGIPSDVSETIEFLKHRLVEMNERVVRTEATLSGKLEHLQETQIDVIKRLHAIENGSKGFAQPYDEKEGAVGGYRYENIVERLARMEAFLAGWEGAQGGPDQSPDLERSDDSDAARDTLKSIKGTIRNWSTTPPPKGDNVVQRSIIKTSSAPPAENSNSSDSGAPKKISENPTMIGMESPVPRKPKWGKN